MPAVRKWNQIVSKIETIEKLRIFPIPARGIEAVRACRVDTTTVLVDGAGRIYSSAVSGHTFWMPRQPSGRTIEGLVRLGMLTPAAKAEHAERVEAEQKRSTMRWQAKGILDTASSAGIKLTVAQRKILERNAKSED